MRDVSLGNAPATEPGPEAELIGHAQAVLQANWLGHATSPSPRLYPHQWSWDAACIAMGYASWNQARAEQELRSLFAGQWRSGLLPHIVFTDGGQYFPGPEFWETDRSPDAPERTRTSALVQPPIHATAVWQVYLRAVDRARAHMFLEELFPKLRAWHEYLYRERCRNDAGLAEIWHPWESGMDNSPLWDEALERVSPDAARMPTYKRVDVRMADASQRPSDAEYDRYVYLVALFRELGYEPARIREVAPFALQPVLFNSLLVRSNQDLVEIARALGSDTEPFRTWSETTAAGLETLWDAERALYVDYDVVGARPVRVATSAGLAPLYAGVPDLSRADRMVERLASSRVHVGDSGWVVTSLSPADPGFQPSRYWRGPVWPILNWVLQRGLQRYGYRDHAEQVRRAIVELGRRSGFWEHYHPLTGRGQGGEQFAWTAALVLDLLEDGATSPMASNSDH
jgi:Trehalase